MDQNLLKSTIYENVLELATDEGIHASGKDDIYGCVFGRDSAITILKLLKVTNSFALTQAEKETIHKICKKALLTLVSLQGKKTNIESGEEPGKFIHEYRKDNYERLLTLGPKPWFVYPDGKLRNYDSLDATPLALIAIYNYWKMTGDDAFLLPILPNIEAGLNWIITYADRDKDLLVEYELSKERKHGGLVVQSWTDSIESMLDKDGKFPLYPIAPVEVQGYIWLALRLWADYYADTSKNITNSDSFARKLSQQADSMKSRFNQTFLLRDNGFHFAAQALDGVKNQIKTITGNPLLLLWATYNNSIRRESILDDEFVSDFVERAFQPDMFDPDAGIRTMSTNALTYDASQNSYHNGSFWPKLNGMVHEGLLHWGYEEHATNLKEATLKPIIFFGSPIELYIKDEKENYLLYQNPEGQTSCLLQAWSAASALDLLTL